MAHSGAWAQFTQTERVQFARLVEDFDDLHVWLLHYFKDPRAWLDAHGLSSAYESIYIGSTSGPLGAALGSPETEWESAVTQAAADLSQSGLAAIQLVGMMTADGTIQPRTHGKGARFLAFLSEPDSVTANPPEDF